MENTDLLNSQIAHGPSSRIEVVGVVESPGGNRSSRPTRKDVKRKLIDLFGDDVLDINNDIAIQELESTRISQSSNQIPKVICTGKPGVVPSCSVANNKAFATNKPKVVNFPKPRYGYKPTFIDPLDSAYYISKNTKSAVNVKKGAVSVNNNGAIIKGIAVAPSVQNCVTEKSGAKPEIKSVIVKAPETNSKKNQRDTKISVPSVASRTVIGKPCSTIVSNPALKSLDVACKDTSKPAANPVASSNPITAEKPKIQSVIVKTAQYVPVSEAATVFESEKIIPEASATAKSKFVRRQKHIDNSQNRRVNELVVSNKNKSGASGNIPKNPYRLIPELKKKGILPFPQSHPPEKFKNKPSLGLGVKTITAATRVLKPTETTPTKTSINDLPGIFGIDKVIVPPKFVSPQNPAFPLPEGPLKYSPTLKKFEYSTYQANGTYNQTFGRKPKYLPV